MILSYEHGISLYVKQTTFTLANFSKFTYYHCVVVYWAVMMLSAGCFGSLEPLSIPGPQFLIDVNSNYTQPSFNHKQCLSFYNRKNFSSVICDDTPVFHSTERTSILRRSELAFCSLYPLSKIIPQDDISEYVYSTNSKCKKFFDDLEQKDYAIYSQYCTFLDLLNKVDCDIEYSVKWTCDKCRWAYRNWLCATQITFYHSNFSKPVSPCQDFCEAVEQKCPFLRPETPYTYAGEPSFICKDRSVDDAPSLSELKLCYPQCHLTDPDCELEYSGEVMTVVSDTNSNSNSNSTSNSCSGQIYRQSSCLWISIVYVSYLRLARTYRFILTGLT